jgi:hypothetical protein
VFRGRREPQLVPEISPQVSSPAQCEGFDYCDNGTMTDDDTNTISRTFEADSKQVPNNDFSFNVAVGPYQ